MDLRKTIVVFLNNLKEITICATTKMQRKLFEEAITNMSGIHGINSTSFYCKFVQS